MTDRELLEMAARAADVFVVGGVPVEPCNQMPSGWRVWNPLEDDGDAFRLMARLSLDVSYSDPEDGPEFVGVYGCRGGHLAREPSHGAAATRRAIVRAAAEMATD